jgi:tripartite-type tricarboxylate transporter receptor subunit TctC
MSLGWAAEHRIYPDKPVRLIVPHPVGTSSDRIAHLIEPLLEAYFGQRFLVDNRSGADGLLGTELAARSTPDGHTLLIGTPGPLTMTAYRRLHPAYDARKDLAPIGLIAKAPFVLAAYPGVPAAGISELRMLARSNRGSLSYGATPSGATALIAMELLRSVAQIDLKPQGYAARAELIGQLLTGQVSVGMLDMREALEHVRARRLRPLAVTSSRRSAALPQVPTAAESGLTGFEATKWTGLLAPARTPKEVQQELAAGLRRALANPGVRWQLAQDGLHPGDGDAAVFESLLTKELAVYGKLTKPLPIRLP